MMHSSELVHVSHLIHEKKVKTELEELAASVKVLEKTVENWDMDEKDLPMMLRKQAE